MLLYLEMIIHSTPYMNGRATTLGVFKAYAFFFTITSSYFYIIGIITDFEGVTCQKPLSHVQTREFTVFLT